MKLILVHGRSQQGKAPDLLQQQWLSALKDGLQNANVELPQGIDIRFPFYGDRLDELIRDLDTPLISDVMSRGASQDTAEADFRGELLYEMAQNAGVTDSDIQSYFKGTYQERGPQNWEWVQSILKALDSKTSLGEAAIEAFTRDVYVYLTNKSVRKAIDGIVSASLSEGSCVVVGHSLGSVVAYNVLRNTLSAVDVRKYVTVGSPLGIRAIKRRLESPLSMPGCVESWFNAMDERDVVALYPLDAHNFNINPAIENKTDVNNHTDNRHGIEGYLDDATVARRIRDALGVD